jgi:hypothetical protein
MRYDRPMAPLDWPAMMPSLVKSLACGRLVFRVHAVKPSGLSNFQAFTRVPSDEAHGPDL